MRTFVEVAKARSFRAAAARLGLSPATATKQVAALEAMLSTRLLDRNSQFVSLTDAGMEMLDGCVRLLEDLEGLAESIARSSTAARGVIRVGVPPSFGANHLVRVIEGFQKTVPDVWVQLILDDGSSNLVQEGLDLSIRIATSLQSTGEIAVLLGRVEQALVATPAYLAQHGTPLHPLDLAHHNCLVHALKSPSDTWSFTGAEGNITVTVKGPIRANFGDALRSAALLGLGISIHPIYMIEDDLKTGALVSLLPDFEPTPLEITAIYPHRRHLPARIRVFLDFTKEWMRRQATFITQYDGARVISQE